MRPLKRRWRAGQRQELDLAATIDGYARSLELIPVFRAAPERWFELFVIVDCSVSMGVWRQTVAELTDVLRKAGAFRKLQVWHLFPGATGAELRGPRHQRLSPRQLSASSGRRLAFVISDCSADGWRTGHAWSLLREWSQQVPAVLVDPLPPRLWRHTGLDLPAVRAGAPGVPGARNTELHHQVPLLESAVAPGMVWVPIPAVALTPYSLGRWARTVMRVDTRGCDAVLIPGQAMFDQFQRAERALGIDAPGAAGVDVVETFIHTASPRAVQLAAYCTELDRIDLALLDIIRAELVPAAEVTDAAEVVTSGLFAIESDEQGETVMRFQGGVRDRLRGKLSADGVGRLTDVLSAYFATHAGSVPGFPLVVADPRGDVAVSADLGPVARASEATLRSMGSGPWPMPRGGSERWAQAVVAIRAGRDRHIHAVRDLGVRLRELGSALKAAEADRTRLLAGTEPEARKRLVSWEAPLRQLAGQVAQERAVSQDLLARFGRQTLNIAVADLSPSGQSSLIRTLTGLAWPGILDGEGGSGVEVPVQIRHAAASQTYAEVSFHSADSFLDEMILPCYRHLGQWPQPASLEEFSVSPLPTRPREGGWPGLVYDELAALQRAFPDYQALIGTTSPVRIDVSQLRTFAGRAAPAGRPRYAYQAVREVHLVTTFPGADLSGLALVNVPRPGESHPADGPARAALRRDSDLVVFVRQPEPHGETVPAADLDLYRFAESSLPPVPVERQSFLILDQARDPDHGDRQQSDLHAARSAMPVAGIAITDCSLAGEVQEAFASVLGYLTANLADLDLLLVEEAIQRVGNIQRSARQLADDMSVVTVGQWADGVRMLRSAGSTRADPGEQVIPSREPAATRTVRDREPVPVQTPRSGAGRPAAAGNGTAAASIALWGAPGSGKATYVTALRNAAGQADASAGRWVLHPRTRASSDTLIKWTHQLVNEGRFPGPGHVGDPTELTWRFVGDLSGTRYARRGRFLRRLPAESQLDLTLVDASGQVFGSGPAAGRLAPGFTDIALRQLSSARGLVFLFDPLAERVQVTAAGYARQTLVRLSSRVLSERRLVGPYLPHYVAVCMTKFDHPDVFRSAQATGLVNYGADGLPILSGLPARELFDAMCERRFWKDDPAVGSDGVLALRNLLRVYFHPDRIRYYAVSAVGYRKPPGAPGAAAPRPESRPDPETICNVAGEDGEQRVLGPVMPLNVLEPLIDLQMQITGRA
jgi:hypothetical protein